MSTERPERRGNNEDREAVMVEFDCGSATHTGMVREMNQDAPFAGDGVFAVADGLGGHNGGEEASAIAAETLADSEPPATIDDLIDLAHAAHSRIVEKAADERGLWGMGTTLCALAVLTGSDPPRLGIVNVGDSRVYRLAAGRLVQCTLDHGFVEQLVREGSISREEAEVHPDRNILTRALGLDPLLVDGWEIAPAAGDRYLLCSDGLVREVDDDGIAVLLADHADPQEAADVLVSEACAAGGRDNVTVVVVDVVEAPEQAEPSAQPVEPSGGSAPFAAPNDRVLSEHLDVSAYGRLDP